MTTGGSGSPTRAGLFYALAENPYIPGILKHYGLSLKDLQQLFWEAAEHYRSLEQEYWTLYVDGASHGNPGPAGAGALLRDSQGRVRVELREYLGEATNNEAEYRALLLGLKAAIHRGIRCLYIFSDSKLVVQQLQGGYQVKSPKLKPLWQSARILLNSFDAYAISHVDRAKNQLADRLAWEAIDQKATVDYNLIE
ncbi:MAG: ribonuclease HI family protein [Desulfobacteraceae bacterium]